MNFSEHCADQQPSMNRESSPSRRLLKGWAALTVIWCVFAMVVAANKNAWDLGPEWCARYMLVKYMLYMKAGSCAHGAIEPPVVDVQAGSQPGTPLL